MEPTSDYRALSESYGIQMYLVVDNGPFTLVDVLLKNKATVALLNWSIVTVLQVLTL